MASSHATREMGAELFAKSVIIVSGVDHFACALSIPRARGAAEPARRQLLEVRLGRLATRVPIWLVL